MAPEAGDLAVLGRRDPAGHVVVAGKRRGRQVFDPVLDPLHRHAGDDRGDDGADVARIDADLVAETAADIGRDDADIVLGDGGDQRCDRAHRMGRLEGAPDRELAVDLVHRGDAAAGLERTGMHALIGDFFFDNHFGISKGLFRTGLVAGSQ